VLVLLLKSSQSHCRCTYIQQDHSDWQYLRGVDLGHGLLLLTPDALTHNAIRSVTQCLFLHFDVRGFRNADGVTVFSGVHLHTTPQIRNPATKQISPIAA
jgi:hypothetical protein